MEPGRGAGRAEGAHRSRLVAARRDPARAARFAKVRRAYFIQQKPIKAICREFGLSRRVVRKVIRSEEALGDARGALLFATGTSLNQRRRGYFLHADLGSLLHAD